jgi:hypothetical protein
VLLSNLVPSSVESFRESVRRETFARALAEGKSLGAAAHAAGLPPGEAQALSQDDEILSLVEELSPEVATILRDGPDLDESPLEIIGRAAKAAALQLAAQAPGSLASAKALLELDIKYRQAQEEAPSKVVVQLPIGRITPLLNALGEFNSLLQTLIEEDRRGRESA